MELAYQLNWNFKNMQNLLQISFIHWLSAFVFIIIGSYSIFKKTKHGSYFLLASVPMIIIPIVFNSRLEKSFSSPQVFGFNVLDSLMAMFTMGIIHAPAGLIMITSGIVKIMSKQDKKFGIALIISGSTLLMTFIAFLIRFQVAMG